MIAGLVTDRREAVLPMLVTGPAESVETSAIVDNGFTGSLTLPMAVVSSLDLVGTSRGYAVLADGSEQEFDECRSHEPLTSEDTSRGCRWQPRRI